VKIRVRRVGPDRSLVYETGEELILSPLVNAYCGVVFVEDVVLPAAKLAVEVLIDGSVAGARLINLGHERT
jgi:hypothetical protein